MYQLRTSNMKRVYLEQKKIRQIGGNWIPPENYKAVGCYWAHRFGIKVILPSTTKFVWTLDTCWESRYSIICQTPHKYTLCSHTHAHTHNAPRHLFYGNWIDFPSHVLLMRLTLNKKKRKKKKNIKKNIRRNLLLETYVMLRPKWTPPYKTISPKCTNSTSAFQTKLRVSHTSVPLWVL